MTSKPTLLLVVGLGHSGTTILDAALGCAPGIVGVGEAIRLFAGTKSPGKNIERMNAGRFADVACSCGATAQDCPVWSQFSVEELRSGDLAALYPRLYSLAISSAPDTHIVLDSTPGALKRLDCLDAFEVRVLMVTRDVRSWAASNQRRRKWSAWRSFNHWRVATQALEARIRELGLPAFRLGYEEFALRPAEILTEICDWLDVPFTTDMLTPYGKTKSHIITGNSQVKDPQRAALIRYDGTWMANARAPWLTGLLYAMTFRQNERLVYSNGVIRPNA